MYICILCMYVHTHDDILSRHHHPYKSPGDTKNSTDCIKYSCFKKLYHYYHLHMNFRRKKLWKCYYEYKWEKCLYFIYSFIVRTGAQELQNIQPIVEIITFSSYIYVYILYHNHIYIYICVYVYLYKCLYMHIYILYAGAQELQSIRFRNYNGFFLYICIHRLS
jgi:hypothetical protein